MKSLSLYLSISCLWYFLSRHSRCWHVAQSVFCFSWNEFFLCFLVHKQFSQFDRNEFTGFFLMICSFISLSTHWYSVLLFSPCSVFLLSIVCLDSQYCEYVLDETHLNSLFFKVLLCAIVFLHISFQYSYLLKLSCSKLIWTQIGPDGGIGSIFLWW